jgi:phosphoribosyl 1,2-cyclic phosphodiesterase
MSLAERSHILLRFALLGSGSSGNAMLVASPDCKVLIDNGFSLKELQARVAGIGETLEGLKALFVTHEHSDHVKGIGILARRLGVPVYMTPKTYENLPESVGELSRVELFESGESVTIDGLTLASFNVCHDAADPVSFVVQSKGVKLGLAADLGHAPRYVKQRLEGSHALILESNHCPDMLHRGSYPPALKQRIRSRYGHLSNVDMTSLLASLLHDALQIVVLVHLSQENNSPDLAHKMAADVLKGHRAELYVAHQDVPTPLFAIRSGAFPSEPPRRGAFLAEPPRR